MPKRPTAYVRVLLTDGAEKVKIIFYTYEKVYKTVVDWRVGLELFFTRIPYVDADAENALFVESPGDIL